MGTIWAPSLDHSEKTPKYVALGQALRRGIRDGHLTPGEQLPTVRDLAFSLKITPGTVARAYKQGVEDGMLEAVVGRGTFVAGENEAAPDNMPASTIAPKAGPGQIDLRGCRTPIVGQEETIRQILQDVSAKPNLDYVGHPVPGADLAARQAVCGWVAKNGITAEPEDVVLSYGAQNSVIVALLAVLKGPTPIVATDDLAFSGMRLAARHLRAEMVGIEQDSEGLRPDRLEKACRRNAVQVLLTSTGAHNPTTVETSPARRQEIAALAREYDFQIIEDDAYGVRPADAPMYRSLCKERTWYASSLTKSVSAGLRFGYLICPPDLGRTGRNIMRSQCYGMSQLTVDIGARFITSGAAETYRRRILEVTAERVRFAVNILGRWDISWREDIPFFWLRLPQGWRSSSFAMACERQGILVRPADEFALGNGRAPSAVRIAANFSISMEEFERVLRVIDDLLGAPPMITDV